MEILLEKEDRKAKLKLSLKEADYKPKVAEKVKEYSKKASIKGFRPGKVPTSLIERMYGKGILLDEINNIISSSITNYIKEEKLNIVGEPIPSEENNNVDFDNQKDFEFVFKIGLVPEFQVELSENIKETRYDIIVDDQVINETIDNLKSQFGEMADVEAVEGEDFVSGELKAVEGEFHQENTMFPMNKIVEAAKDGFLGKKVGDTIRFDVTKTFEDAAAIAMATGMTKEEAESAQGEYELKVSSIKRKQLAELNQDFYDKIFGKDAVDSEEAFREKLKNAIEENYKVETESLLNRDIEQHLVKNTTIELPDEFLQDWLLSSNKGKINKEDIDKEYGRFSDNLKWNLIRNKVAEESELKAENHEIIEKAKGHIRQQFGGMPLNEEMEEMLNKIADNFLRQDNGKNYANIYEQVLNEKTMSTIKEKIAIEDKKISLEEFKNLALK